jgi:hypothetical protein
VGLAPADLQQVAEEDPRLVVVAAAAEVGAEAWELVLELAGLRRRAQLQRRARDGLPLFACLGFGRILVLEKEVPNLFANLV